MFQHSRDIASRLRSMHILVFDLHCYPPPSLIGDSMWLGTSFNVTFSTHATESSNAVVIVNPWLRINLFRLTPNPLMPCVIR